MTLALIDVSEHQRSTPDLTRVDGVIARACYGSRLDTRFAQHIAAARKVGCVVGAYLFGRSTEPVELQLRMFRAAIEGVGGVDLAAVDRERDTHPDAPADPPMTSLQTRQAIAGVRAFQGAAGLYQSASGYPPDALGADWRWVADYRGTPPTIPWDIWQWTSTGGLLDRSTFRGTRDELLQLGKGDMPVTIDVANATPQLVDLTKGTQLLDPLGAPYLVLGQDRAGVLSPFATFSAGGTAMRTIVHTRPDPDPDLLLGVYTNQVHNMRPVPGQDTAGAVNAALDAVHAAEMEARPK